MAGVILQSSPLSSAPSSQAQHPVTLSQQLSTWRSVRELPFELQQLVRIYFEEALFKKAFDLLLSIVTSDASSPRLKITIPPPEYLALTATLVVHPLNTTRTKSEEKWVEANAGLRLLRLLLKTTGPINAGFREAFEFRKLYRVTTDDGESDVSINHSFAKEDSLWNRAEDFWATVGWAMNCSCLPDMYANRWEYWQLWMELMADTLSQDWQYHLSNQSCDKSMLWSYMSHLPGDTSKPRRVVRSIFADGGNSALNEFREIFKNELKAPKQESDKTKKLEAVDIDKEIYGDYLVQDDSDNSSENELRSSTRASTRTLSARRITPRTSRQSLRTDHEDDTPSTPIQGLGPPESIRLRLRLMQLLVNAASQSALIESRITNFPTLANLFTLYVEFIRPLPLSTFQQMTSPSISTANLLSINAHTTLLESILQRLLETTPSKLSTLEPLTQAKLVVDYLPHAAGKHSLDANARVSLCIEALLRNLANAKMLVKSDALSEAVEKGVERRLAKVRDKRDKVKEGSEEEEALGWLVESSARMRGVVRRLKG